MHKLILKSLIVLVIVLAIARVVVSNLISTSGVALNRLTNETAEVKTENDSLREKLFSLSSFENIASEAAKVGFTDKKDNFVLTNPLPVALR